MSVRTDAASPAWRAGLRRAVEIAIERRAWIVGAMALLLCVPSRAIGDWPILAQGAQRLFGQYGLTVFAHTAQLQTGPVSLVAVRGFQTLGPHAVAAANVVMALAGAALVLTAERLVLRCRPALSSGRVALVTLLLAFPVLWMWSSAVSLYMHLDDVLAIVLTFAAIAAWQAGHRTLAATLAGLAVGAKPWAVYAIPMIAGACAAWRPSAHRWRPLAVCLAVVAGCWLPFLLAAPHTVATGTAVYPLAPDSSLRVFGLSGDNSPPWDRTFQLLMVALVASVLAWRRDWLIAPAAGMLTRLLLDWQTFPYFASSAIMCLLVVDLVRGGRPWRVLTLWAGLALDVRLQPSMASAWVHTLVLLAILVEMLAPGEIRRLCSALTRRVPDRLSVPVWPVGATAGDSAALAESAGLHAQVASTRSG